MKPPDGAWSANARETPACTGYCASTNLTSVWTSSDVALTSGWSLAAESLATKVASASDLPLKRSTVRQIAAPSA